MQPIEQLFETIKLLAFKHQLGVFEQTKKNMTINNYRFTFRFIKTKYGVWMCERFKRDLGSGKYMSKYKYTQIYKAVIAKNRDLEQTVFDENDSVCNPVFTDEEATAIDSLYKKVTENNKI